MSDRDVHVWRVWLDQPDHYAILAQTLSPEERARAARFRTKDGQRRFARARGFLRAVLGRYLEIEPAQVQFAYTHEGKPYLPAVEASGLAFNLAHSHDLAICAVARAPSVGIDAERIHSLSDLDQIVRRFFSPREVRLFQSIPPTEKQRAFFDAWTRKEACLKAMGRGVAQGLDGVEVTFGPEEPVNILAIDGDRAQAEQWSIYSLTPAPNYAAAIAVTAKNMRFCRSFNFDHSEL